MRRHRPGGRVRLPLRHGEAAGARRAGADPRPDYQQIPGGCGHSPARPGAAGGAHRQAGAGGCPHAGRGCGRRGLPVLPAGEHRQGGSGGHRGGAPAPPVQLHRLQSPGADGGRHPPLCHLPPGAGAPGSGGDPGHQEHHGRPALAAAERHGGRHTQARLRRRRGGGHLRRLSDAGADRLRPGRGGGGRHPEGPGPAPCGYGVPGGKDPHPGDRRLPGPGGHLRLHGGRPLRGLRDPHGPHRERRRPPGGLHHPDRGAPHRRSEFRQRVGLLRPRHL